MSADEKSNPYEPAAGASDERELFVTTDLRGIPAMELRPMCKGFSDWLMTVLTFKLLRMKSEPAFAYESRRLVKVEAEQVSKRIMKRFNELASEATLLGFVPNYYASLPAVGPIAAAVMTMSRKDGRVHFFAVQVAARTDGQINDDGHFGFLSYRPDQSSLVTICSARLPRPRRKVDRLVVRNDDPAEVLRLHRKRIRNLEILPIEPEELFEQAAKEKRIEADDLLGRRIIRPATQGEITRIRQQSRV